MRKSAKACAVGVSFCCLSFAPAFAQSTESGEQAGDPNAAVDADRFAQCAQIQTNAARLACFDALASNAADLGLGQKPAMHLTGTLKSAITGGQAVMIDPSQSAHPDAKTASATDREGASSEFGLSASDVAQYTPLSLAFDLDKNSEHGLWSARPHNATYILPLYFNTDPNRNPSAPNQETENYTTDTMRIPELKFQLSLKTKAAENVFGTGADLWLGYTQLSHWQVYNAAHSRPFRAHDYEPEVFVTQPVVADLPFGGRLRMVGAGFVHHSNGESDPLSRSWNRAYAMGGAEWGRLTVMPRAWVRILNKDGTKPDDNPDILDYYGYGDVKFLYQAKKGDNVSGVLRYNPKTGKGAAQIDYVYPFGKGINGYVQLFHGYGQSLIDYNHKATSIGFGFMLNDWLGL